MLSKEYITKQTKDVLKYLGMYSEWSFNLLMGTFATESAMGKSVRQIGFKQHTDTGAFGIGQMEIKTLRDHYQHYLDARPELKAKIEYLYIDDVNLMSNDEIKGNLMFNLPYAIAMTRIDYWRESFEIPEDPNDIEALARIYKQYYNSSSGKVTEQKFIDDYHKHVI